ncbi:hypothetical protein CMI37_09855 [Candidatus Pacearchaeota archaeon]|nr:hypothetical protein [Candidatus Pacearchaeota archaeon]
MADEEHQQHLTLMMTEMVTKMQVLLDKQDELGENISKIKEAVYNPDKGLYARLNKLDARLDNLEVWKNNNAKILWIIVTVGLGLVISAGWQAIF